MTEPLETAQAFADLKIKMIAKINRMDKAKEAFIQSQSDQMKSIVEDFKIFSAKLGQDSGSTELKAHLDVAFAEMYEKKDFQSQGGISGVGIKKNKQLKESEDLIFQQTTAMDKNQTKINHEFKYKLAQMKDSEMKVLKFMKLQREGKAKEKNIIEFESEKKHLEDYVNYMINREYSNSFTRFSTEYSDNTKTLIREINNSFMIAFDHFNDEMIGLKQFSEINSDIIQRIIGLLKALDIEKVI